MAGTQRGGSVGAGGTEAGVTLTDAGASVQDARSRSSIEPMLSAYARTATLELKRA